MVAHSHDSTGDAPATRDKFEQAVDDAVARARSLVERGYYDAEWDSLARYNQAPEWFRDAKLGVYFTWGPYSVPAYKTEWYPRQMYNEDVDLHEAHRVIDHHVETYWQPDEAPYQDFVPEFNAENFDPGGWADLFVEMGARFAGPIVEHHDGWSNWDSAINPWNAGDRGASANTSSRRIPRTGTRTVPGGLVDRRRRL